MPAAYSYSGLSDFFNTPAGKALMALSSGPPQGGPRGAAPRGGMDEGGLFASMRPSLRNTIADEYGEDQLRQIRNRQPTVFHRAAGLRGSDGGWIDTPSVEVFDPERDAPIVANENARRNTMLNADSMVALQEILGPRAAETNEQMQDISARGAAGRYWRNEMPIEVDRGERAMELANVKGQAATLDDIIRAAGQRDVATIRADASRKDPSQAVAAAVAEMSRSGAFGRDRQGHPLPPPPGVSESIMRELNDLLSGGGTPRSGPPAGAPPGPAATPGPAAAPRPNSGAPAGGRRISRAQIAAAVQAGEVGSLEEGIRQAQAAGLQVY